jgi:ABC-2 type transport system ATP-binding protein
MALHNGEYAIECYDLTRRFGDFTAVDTLNLKVKRGELFGFLGPNGAGKTTTIRMLTTLLLITAGKAKVAGLEVASQGALIRSRIGVVPQQFALFDELTPMENLRYIGELYGMSKTGIRKRSEELLKVVDLYDKKDVISEGFSGGMKQKLSVAAGLLHSPDILFMDEPTTGLDPQSRIALRNLTRELNRTGITIVYTTHDMEEADKLCDRIAIMDLGKLAAIGTSQELKALMKGERTIELQLERKDKSLVEAAGKLVGATKIEMSDDLIEMSVGKPSSGMVSKLSNFFTRRKVGVKEIHVKEPTLEDVFMYVTGKTPRD